MTPTEKHEHARALIAYLKEHTKNFPPTLCDAMALRFGNDPFIILSACLISLRARDRTTTPICSKLFERAPTPQKLLDMGAEDLERVLFSVGYYKAKTATLRAVAQALIDRHQGQVPANYELLRALPGVGPKTANLVMGFVFDVPSMCVDVHVHKLSNALGWVTTKTPEQTEAALRRVLPEDVWVEWNRQFVLMGQNKCLTRRGCGQTCRAYELGKLG